MASQRIFLSYRRDDSATPARRIADSLEATFGEDEVFLDVDDIPAGLDFAHELLRALRQCDVLLIVIGPTWLTVPDKKGRRRIDDPLDYVRMEIAEGLSRALPIIPILIGDTPMPGESELPKNIRSFHRRQAVEVMPESADDGMAQLTDRIRSVLEEADQERVRKDNGVSISDYFEMILPYQFRARSQRAAEIAGEVHGTVLFEVTGDEGGSWALILDESGPHIEAGPREDADLILRFSDEAMHDLIEGKLDARESIATGALTLSGNLELLREVGTLVFGG